MYADPQTALELSRDHTARRLAEAETGRLSRAARGERPAWWRRAQRAHRRASRSPDAAAGVASSMS